MRMRAWFVLSASVLVSLSVVLLFGIPSRAQVALPEKGSVLTVAINVFKKTYAPGEPVPLAVATANAEPHTLYVIKRIDPPFVEVRNAKGTRLIGDPIPTPGPVPPDRYMMRGGRRVLMHPVQKLENGGGTVLVIPDAFKLYHKHVVKGTYSLQLSVSMLNAYEKAEVVRRENLAHKEWVEATNRGVQMPVNCNTVEITIE